MIRNKTIEIGMVERESNSPEAQGRHTVYVKDNGIGIREKHLDAVFRIFKRLHSRNKFGGGEGAGLTFVKKIVERHGGHLWVESTYGEGSTFYFSIEETYDEPAQAA